LVILSNNKTEISNLLRMTRFWNACAHNQKNGKSNNLKIRFEYLWKKYMQNNFFTGIKIKTIKPMSRNKIMYGNL
jgi:hypothetical protein